jgi:Txe/YoeB family toxin of Txe-Axe toxin-antitoxin module
MEVMRESKEYNTFVKQEQKKLDKINELVTEILCNRAGFCSCELPEQNK